MHSIHGLLRQDTHRLVRAKTFSREGGSCPLKLLLDKSLKKGKHVLAANSL